MYLIMVQIQPTIYTILLIIYTKYNINEINFVSYNKIENKDEIKKKIKVIY